MTNKFTPDVFQSFVMYIWSMKQAQVQPRRIARDSDGRPTPWLSLPEAPARPTRKALASARAHVPRPLSTLALSPACAWGAPQSPLPSTSVTAEHVIFSLEVEVATLLARLQDLESEALAEPDAINFSDLRKRVASAKGNSRRAAARSRQIKQETQQTRHRLRQSGALVSGE